MNCPQKRCEPSCAFCLDANEPFLAAPLIFLFSYNARTGYQRSAKRECRQGLRIVRYHFFEKAGKRLSCGPAIFAKKLQKSRDFCFHNEELCGHATKSGLSGWSARYFVSRETGRCVRIGFFGAVGTLLGNFERQGCRFSPTSIEEAPFMEGV